MISSVAIKPVAKAALLVGLWFNYSPALAEEEIPRVFLIDIARNQFSILCQSEAFASCMGFTSETCLALSEEAIKQCLLPLPESINPDELENSSLESCPQSIFADAGHSEEQAGLCFDKAMQ